MKYILIVLSLALTVTACKKKSSTGCNYTEKTTVAPSAERARVLKYLDSMSITNYAELGSSGMFYVIENAGTGIRPVLCSYVTIKYVGSLPSGTVFDQTPGTSTATFQLGGLIEGWQRGLPLIGAGGKIKLYIPASLGYGATGSYNSNTGVYTIPPNSMIIFSIEMSAVSN